MKKQDVIQLEPIYKVTRYLKKTWNMSDNKMLLIFFIAIILGMIDIVVLIDRAIQRDYLYAFLDTIFLILLIFFSVFAIKGKRGSIVLSILFPLFIISWLIVCIILGGKDGFGLNWLILAPFVTLYCYGKKRGSIFSLIIFSCILFFFFTDFGHTFLKYSYPDATMKLFPLVYFGFYLIGFIMEADREKKENLIYKLKEEKEILLKNEVSKLETDLMNTQIKMMINQIHPHFLYNTLAAIRSIVKDNPELAYSLMYDFINLLRQMVKSVSMDNEIPFVEEINNVKSYLNIQKFILGEKLNIHYHIVYQDFKIVPFSIQPFVENAIKHGLRNKKQGEINIRTYQENENIFVEIEDDGIGFELNSPAKDSETAVGMSNSIYRIENMSNAKVKVESIINKGTKIIIKIPNIK